jgi:hypothetical protein
MSRQLGIRQLLCGKKLRDFHVYYFAGRAQ